MVHNWPGRPSIPAQGQRHSPTRVTKPVASRFAVA